MHYRLSKLHYGMCINKEVRINGQLKMASDRLSALNIQYESNENRLLVDALKNRKKRSYKNQSPQVAIQSAGMQEFNATDPSRLLVVSTINDNCPLPSLLLEQKTISNRFSAP
jgi:hypothetical protein